MSHRQPKNPDITVIIPAYNEETYLPACLAALTRQTISDFEVIVVDNNSTDSTATIAKEWGARVVKEPRQGMIPARNRGFQEARADIVARTDADTVVPPEWLESILREFANSPDVVGVATNLTIPVAGGQPPMKFYNLLCRILLGHPQLNGPSMAVRKSAWAKTHPCTDDRKVHEDIDLSIHMGRVGKIVLLPNVYVRYSLRRVHQSPLLTAGEYSFRFVRTFLIHLPLFQSP